MYAYATHVIHAIYRCIGRPHERADKQERKRGIRQSKLSAATMRPRSEQNAALLVVASTSCPVSYLTM